MEKIDSFNVEVRRNFKFNFTVNLLDVSFFMFASSFISSSGVFIIYVTHFTQNPLLIGLIPIISTTGFLVPQLFTANIVERATIKKFFPFNLGFFLERIPVLLLWPSSNSGLPPIKAHDRRT